MLRKVQGKADQQYVGAPCVWRTWLCRRSSNSGCCHHLHERCSLSVLQNNILLEVLVMDMLRLTFRESQ